MNDDNTPYLENPLQYNAYLANPDSKVMFPELNKDLSISNISKPMQKVILIKGRVANYLGMIFKDAYLSNDKNMPIPYVSKAATSFMRDIMAIGVTSQGLNAMLLRKLTESSQNVRHSYSMDKEYSKNMGGK
jgi:hypothetical protein